jgi:hypothetical protein
MIFTNISEQKLRIYLEIWHGFLPHSPVLMFKINLSLEATDQN